MALLEARSEQVPIEVIAFDHLGYGSSSKPAVGAEDAESFYSPAAQARRLEDALNQLGIARAVFVVHDLGGPIVWEHL
jgi:pimeloyl-ACP methyl ester carboxylesterase